MFPHLYECSACGKPVKVTVRDGQEPDKQFSCEHTTAIIWANRRVTLHGKGSLENAPAHRRAALKIKLTVRQLLSYLTGRSI